MIRKRHKPLPVGVEYGAIYKNRIWTLHPTKGLRSRRVYNISRESTGIRILDLLKVIFSRRLE